MNNFRIAKIIIVFSSLSYLSVSFLRNYNSPENIEKRCILKFEKDFKINLETSNEEWNQILDLADNNYFKCMGIPHYYLWDRQRYEKIYAFRLEKKLKI